MYFFNQTVCKQGSRTQFQSRWKLESVNYIITYCRGSGPIPGTCTLGAHIKHADDPETNSIFFIGYCSVQSPHMKLLCYLCASQYRMEQVIHDIKIKYLKSFDFLD